MKQTLMQRVSSALLVAALAMAGSFTSAATLSLKAGTQPVTLGVPFSIDLLVSGVGSPDPGSIGAFDLNLQFDPQVFALQSYALGELLGNLGLGDAFDYTLLGSGSIQLTEVSFLQTELLDALQPSSFKLATLSFIATATTPPAGSLVSISQLFSLSLASGQALAVNNVTLSNLTITAVPEPASALLMLAGVGVLGTRVWRQRRK